MCALKPMAMALRSRLTTMTTEQLVSLGNRLAMRLAERLERRRINMRWDVSALQATAPEMARVIVAIRGELVARGDA